MLTYLFTSSLLSVIPPSTLLPSFKKSNRNHEGSTVIACKPQPSFISLPLCFPLLPHLRAFVCSLFFRPSSGYDWQRAPRLVVVRELLFFGEAWVGAGQLASRENGATNGRDGWKSSFRACREAWVRSGKGRGNGMSSFLLMGLFRRAERVTREVRTLEARRLWLWTCHLDQEHGC